MQRKEREWRTADVLLQSGPQPIGITRHISNQATFTDRHSPYSRLENTDKKLGTIGIVLSVKENPGLSGFYPNGVSDRGFGACGVWGWLVGSAPLARGEVGWGIAVFLLFFFCFKNGGGNVHIALLPALFFRCLLSRENPS